MVKHYISQHEFSCNVYLVIEDNKAILIDPGTVTHSLKRELENIDLKAILLTHGHFDHIGGLDIIHKLYENVPIYSAETKEFITNPRHNGSKLFNKDITANFDIINLNEETLDLNPFDVKCFLTPGHTEGGCVFYFEKQNIIFFGDTIIGDSVGRTDLFGGNYNKLKQSLQKISLLSLKDDTICYFGHGEPLTFKDLKKLNPYLN